MESGESQSEFALSDRRAPRFSFDFHTWARGSRFDYPEHCAPMLERLGSPAEAFFLRALLRARDTIYEGGDVAYWRGAEIRAQVPCGPYVVDFLASASGIRLAVEIDGHQFHHETANQVAADYRRARLLMAGGIIVCRFTGAEAMQNPAGCWRETFAILKAQSIAHRRFEDSA